MIFWVLVASMVGLIALSLYAAREHRQQQRMAALWRKERAVVAALRDADQSNIAQVSARAHAVATEIRNEGCLIEAAQLRHEMLKAAIRVRDDRKRYEGWVNEKR